MPYKLATYKHDRFPLSSSCPASIFAWGSPRPIPLKYIRPFPHATRSLLLSAPLPRPGSGQPARRSFRPAEFYISFRFHRRRSVVRKTWRINVVIALDRVLLHVSRGGDLEEEGAGDRNAIRVDDGWKRETEKGDKWRTRGRADSFNPRGSPRSESPSPSDPNLSPLSIATYRFLYAIYPLASRTT